MKYSSQLWSPSSVPIRIEEDRIKLQWPKGKGWVITSNRNPCEVREMYVTIIVILFLVTFTADEGNARFSSERPLSPNDCAEGYKSS